MRVAALYDIHGNLPALEAVLAELDDVQPELIVFGGDVAAGPFPAETVELLRALAHRARFVLGNADRPDDEHPESSWVRERLGAEARAFLGTFEDGVRLQVDGLGPTLFRHGSPRSVDETVTTLTPDRAVREMLEGVEERTVVIGHTHVQFDRTVDGHRVVNAGSVGMAYEGVPGAYWALLGPDVELRRTSYDVGAAAKRIGSTGYPRDELAGWLVSPPRPDEVSAFFEKQAGR